MAEKTIYLPKKVCIGVEQLTVKYEYFSGFALSQKQKSINSLHKATKKIYNISNILEVSTKSTTECGVLLSAFNLLNNGYSVEQVFQAGKVFENGGPYIDLLEKSSKEAKTDLRLKSSGSIISFKYQNIEFPIEPKTYFYDWLYSNALLENKDLLNKALEFEAFSDIEFNEKKSINCQAYSLALFCSIVKNKPELLNSTSVDKEYFLNLCLNEYKARKFSNVLNKSLVSSNNSKSSLPKIKKIIKNLSKVELELNQLFQQNNIENTVNLHNKTIKETTETIKKAKTDLMNLLK